MELEWHDLIIVIIQILWQVFDLHDFIITTIPDINPL